MDSVRQYTSTKDLALAVWRRLSDVSRRIDDATLLKSLGPQGAQFHGEASTYTPDEIGNRVRALLGVRGARSLLDARPPWRELRGEVGATLALMRALAQEVHEEASLPLQNLLSASLRHELGVLELQRYALNAFDGVPSLWLAQYYLVQTDTLTHMEHVSKMLRADHHAAGAIDLFRRILDGVAHPFDFLKELIHQIDRDSGINVKMAHGFEVEHFIAPQGAHAFAFKHLMEEVMACVAGCASPLSPLTLYLDYNPRRTSLDIKLEGGLCLDEMLRGDPEAAARMRAEHDGWWLEGDRLVIPLKPLRDLCRWEIITRQIWERFDTLVPIMRMLVAGNILSDENREVWRQNIAELDHTLDGLKRYQNMSDRNTCEGEITAELFAELHNALMSFAFIPEQVKESGAVKDSRVAHSALRGVVSRGFPKRMTVFDTLNIVLGRFDSASMKSVPFRDLTIEQDRSGDLLVAPRIQYAVNRMCNGMLVLMGQLAAGAPQGHTVHIAMEEGTLVFTSALLAAQFSVPEVMQPKLVRSVRAWADYCTPHGEGLSCDPAQSTVRVPLETFVQAADADTSFESGPLYIHTPPPRHAPLNTVSFYPTAWMPPARTVR